MVYFFCFRSGVLGLIHHSEINNSTCKILNDKWYVGLLVLLQSVWVL